MMLASLILSRAHLELAWAGLDPLERGAVCDPRELVGLLAQRLAGAHAHTLDDAAVHALVACLCGGSRAWPWWCWPTERFDPETGRLLPSISATTRIRGDVRDADPDTGSRWWGTRIWVAPAGTTDVDYRERGWKFCQRDMEATGRIAKLDLAAVREAVRG